MPTPLATVFSTADSLKRRLVDALRNPGGYARQVAGGIQDSANAQEQRMAQAFGNPNRPLQVTDRQALSQAADAMLTGPLGFAPVGMTSKVKSALYPRAEALETARKNGVTMLGLPENNTPMDRAKAMGFEDAYHGTAQDVPAFDLSKAGSEMKSDWGRAAYLTPSPANANYYAIEAGAKKAKNLAFAEYEKAEKLYGSNSDKTLKALNDFRAAAREAEASPTGANVMPLMVDTRKAESYVPQHGMTDPYLFDTLRLGHNGKDVVRILDGNKATNELAVYNPSRIRSRFAAFDPARINENDLLGRASLPFLGLLGLGSGGAAYLSKDSQQP